ncbi:MAG: hypothetical protein RSD57_00290 [Comamonas sp.]
MQTAGISADLLTPSARQRFSQLFGVAARKSVLPWKEVPRDRAQMLVIDPGMADVISSLGRTPCVVCIGNVRGDILNDASWVGRLEVSYTLSDLIDVLDRAAVFLLDWEARQKIIAHRNQAETVSAAPASGAKQEFLYQLKSWVSMGAPFNTGACIRALALLSREPVSLSQLCTHSGLDAGMARNLLVELGHRGVLRGIAMQDRGPAAPQRPSQTVHSSGLLGRLGRWIRGGGKAA